jgi:hypothetical protein
MKLSSQTLDIWAGVAARVRNSQWDAPFELHVQKSADRGAKSTER